MEFRTLKPEEIEIRVARATDKGAQFLLYKDARCDMAILDETVGAMNWQREHREHNGNLFCAVGIYSEDLSRWVWKEDAGAESNTEAEKGHASDSFKRACVNWGLGRELYTSPFIWIDGCTEKNQNGKVMPKREFNNLRVSAIEYDSKRTITGLKIVNRRGDEVYSFGKTTQNANKRASERSETAPKQEPKEEPKSTQARHKTPIEGKDGYYYCEQCGGVINSFGSMSPKDVAAYGLTAYGKQLCIECGRKQNK